MNKLKTLVKDWVPPVAIRFANKIGKFSLGFEGDYSSWEDAAAHCTGYQAENILRKVLEATLKVESGDARYERDSVLFDEIERAWQVTAGLMWVAAQSDGKLNVLDFGGALGSSYFQNRSLLTSLSEVRWSIVEQAHYVMAGREHIKDENLKFYFSIEECLLENAPNVILISGALQFIEGYKKIIDDVVRSGVSVLIIDRTPFIDGEKDRIFVQRVPSSIYKASYPMWAFSETFFKKQFPDFECVGEGSALDGVRIADTGVTIRFKGMIMKRRE